ncbi:MAG: TatD family hydrolase [Thermoprotei archaeon]|nr:TatD family hydrolase [Thermoprotei archaeon]
MVGDAHAHSNPIGGLGAKVIAEKFKASGGWFIALVALPPSAYKLEPPSLEAYIKAVEVHVSECSRARHAGLKVACIAGFHPAEVDKLVDKYGFKPLQALELGYKIVDYVAELVEKGVLDGIGEVGRQHYKTTSDRALIAQLILERAMEHSRDKGLLVHMHLEQAGEATVELTDKAAARLGAPKNKLLFHHADPKTAIEAWKKGYPSSIPGTPKLLEYALNNLNPFYMIESDYIDDLKRGGAVAYPWEMAYNINKLVKENKNLEEKASKILIDNVAMVYNVEPP